MEKNPFINEDYDMFQVRGSLKEGSFGVDEQKIQDIMSKLLFVSKIKKGERLDVQNLQLEQTNMITSVYRTIFMRGSESRNKTLNFITELVNESLNVANKCIHSSNKFQSEVGNSLLDSLLQSKEGIQNLTETYKDDRMFVSKIETLLNILDKKINHIKNNL